MSTPRPLLSAIVISYNTREMTVECLQVLQTSLAGLPAEVWVVDNASTDGSPEAIRRLFPEVRLLCNERNVGFGAANNQAMAQARGEFLLLLNSDAFPRLGAVEALLECLRSDPRTAAAGPRLLNADGSLQRSCYRFPSPLQAWLENLGVSALLPSRSRFGNYRAWRHSDPREVDFVIGACMLVRREAYQQVGGFDERFFMYAEETDWQRRMWGAGWKIAFTPAAEVVHLGGASGRAEATRINRYFFESLDLYERKHHGVPGLVSLRLAMTIGCLLRLVLWSALALALPARRDQARAKARLMMWLVVRQLTCWPPSLLRRSAC